MDKMVDKASVLKALVNLKVDSPVDPMAVTVRAISHPVGRAADQGISLDVTPLAAR